jgi:hypothetical protein
MKDYKDLKSYQESRNFAYRAVAIMLAIMFFSIAAGLFFKVFGV